MRQSLLCSSPELVEDRVMPPKVALGRKATYQDVLDAPEHVVAEIINGTLYTHPRPAPWHATVASRLAMILGGPFDIG